MISESEPIICGCAPNSLCNCCRNENFNSNNNWRCADENATEFIRSNSFYNGKCLCASGKNPDCVYKYDANKIIAIEIKDQPENNINYDNLVDKIRNSYDCACGKELILVAFILQVSSIKNSSKGKYQLLQNCEYGLNMHKLKIGKDGMLFGKNKDLKHIRAKFYVVKCKDFKNPFPQ